MNEVTEESLTQEANAATAMFSGVVRKLLDDGVSEAALVIALSNALGVMLATAPSHMAASVEAAALRVMRESRAATWEAIDSAAEVH